MKVGSMFSGVGGLELGLEWAGVGETVWQAEVDPHASQVLARHWPDVPNLGDVTAVDWSQVEPVDVLCGGFPCQDISYAGLGAGLQGERSGLWWELWRAAGGLRPRWLVVENVAALRNRGLDVVTHSLASIGYVGSWATLRASDVGAPHQRARIFLVAADADVRRELGREPEPGWHSEQRVATGRDREVLPADAERGELQRRRGLGELGAAPGRAEGAGAQRERDGDAAGHRRAASADAPGSDTAEQPPSDGRHPTVDGSVVGAGNRDGWREPAEGVRVLGSGAGVAWGPYEPAIRRWEHALGRRAPDPVDDRGRLNAPFVGWMMGFPEGWTDGLGRNAALRCLGNAVVPQVAEVVGRQLAAVPVPA